MRSLKIALRRVITNLKINNMTVLEYLISLSDKEKAYKQLNNKNRGK